MARKLTIVRVETSSLAVIRPARGSIELWCPQCSAIVRMITPEQAACLSGLAPRAIYRRVENGELHFTEIDSGGLLVCADSLPQT